MAHDMMTWDELTQQVADSYCRLVPKECVLGLDLKTKRHTGVVCTMPVISRTKDWRDKR